MELFKEIEKQIKTQKKVVIAIDGPSASGKSTFGNMLKNKYNALLFHTDNYFLPKERQTIDRLKESGGNVDYERIKSDIIDNLYNEYLKSNHFNCVTNQLEKKQKLKNKQVIVIEGAYSMHPSLFPHYTLTVLLEVNPKLQKTRILARNGKIMLKRWEEEWIPLENHYFKTENLKNKVDFIIDLRVSNKY